MEVDSEKPFDAIDFIALYRIAEREVYRNPADEYWGRKLQQARDIVLLDVWRNGASENLDEGARQALDLLMRVLEREGAPSLISAWYHSGIPPWPHSDFVIDNALEEYLEEERQWIRQNMGTTHRRSASGLEVPIADSS